MPLAQALSQGVAGMQLARTMLKGGLTGEGESSNGNANGNGHRQDPDARRTAGGRAPGSTDSPD